MRKRYFLDFGMLAMIIAISVSSCKSTRNTETAETESITQTDQRVYKEGKVIVNIQPDFSADELAAQYKEYNLEALTPTNKTLNAWLFSYDSNKITQPDLIKLLLKDEYVIHAKAISPGRDKTMAKEAVKAGRAKPHPIK